MRRVRGTPLDVFGYAGVRRTERTLPTEYVDLVAAALPHAASHFDLVRELCDAPDMVRGYEQIKLDSVKRYRTTTQELLQRIVGAGA
jgi:indolepyruvate ferredoxin oxidoreductase